MDQETIVEINKEQELECWILSNTKHLPKFDMNTEMEVNSKEKLIWISKLIWTENLEIDTCKSAEKYIIERISLWQLSYHRITKCQKCESYQHYINIDHHYKCVLIRLRVVDDVFAHDHSCYHKY